MPDMDVPPRPVPVGEVSQPAARALGRARLPAGCGGAAGDLKRSKGQEICRARGFVPQRARACLQARPPLAQPQAVPPITCTRASVRSVLMASCSLA